MPSSLPRSLRRWAATAAGVVLVTGLLPAQAQAAPRPAPAKSSKTGDDLPNYDSRAALSAHPPAAAAQRAFIAGQAGSAVRKLRDSLGVQGVVDIDKTTGTPRRVARLEGYLTG